MKQSSNPKMMENEVTQQLLAEYRVGFKSVPELKGRSLQKAPFWWRQGRVELYHEHELGVRVIANCALYGV